MPEVFVRIKWDKPDNKEWLPPSNIKLCLSNQCSGTMFEVTEYSPKDVEEAVISIGGQDIPLRKLADVIQERKDLFK